MTPLALYVVCRLQPPSPTQFQYHQLLLVGHTFPFSFCVDVSTNAGAAGAGGGVSRKAPLNLCCIVVSLYAASPAARGTNCTPTPEQPVFLSLLSWSALSSCAFHGPCAHRWRCFHVRHCWLGNRSAHMPSLRCDIRLVHGDAQWRNVLFLRLGSHLFRTRVVWRCGPIFVHATILPVRWWFSRRPLGFWISASLASRVVSVRECGRERPLERQRCRTEPKRIAIPSRLPPWSPARRLNDEGCGVELGLRCILGCRTPLAGAKTKAHVVGACPRSRFR